MSDAPRKKYQRRRLFEASRYAPPEGMQRIAEERTRDIIGVWAGSLPFGKPIEPKLLAESCYMQGIKMSPEEEWDALVGDYDPIDETGFCRRCNDYPCRCANDALDAIHQQHLRILPATDDGVIWWP